LVARADGDVRVWDIAAIAAGADAAAAATAHVRARGDAPPRAPSLAAAAVLPAPSSQAGARAQLWCLYARGDTLLGGSSHGDVLAWQCGDGGGAARSPLAHAWRFSTADVPRAADGALAAAAVPLRLSGGRAFAARAVHGVGGARRDGVRRLAVVGAVLIATMEHGSIEHFELASAALGE